MHAVEPLLERTVGGLGYELADFEISNHGRMLRIFIDKTLEAGGASGSGVTVGDCELVSRQLSRVFEVEGVNYDRLEVSSPGLDRRLKKTTDFVRFTGQKAEVRLRQPVNGRRRFVGTVCGVEQDGRIALEIDGGRVLLAMAELDRARLVPDVFAGGRK